MKVQVVAKDFKKISRANVTFEGITLISGQNLNGKTTIIKALKTVIDNNSNDRQFRHGTEGFAVGISVTPDEASPITVVYKRNTKVSIRVGRDAPLEKVGRYPLYKVVPQFPIKRIDYNDSIFYPNFSFQSRVPIFDDISVYDLLSSMFSNVARVADRVTEVTHEVENNSKALTAATSKYEYGQSMVLQSKQSLISFTKEYPTLQSLATRSREKLDLLQKRKGYEADIVSDDLVLMSVDNSELFLSNEQKLRDALKLKNKLDSVSLVIYQYRNSVAQVEEQQNLLASFEGMDEALAKNEAFKYKAQLDTVSENLAQADKRIAEYPEGVELLLQAIPLVKDWTSAKNDLVKYTENLARLDEEHAELQKEIDAVGVCPYKLEGMCPETK